MSNAVDDLIGLALVVSQQSLYIRQLEAKIAELEKPTPAPSGE